MDSGSWKVEDEERIRNKKERGRERKKERERLRDLKSGQD